MLWVYDSVSARQIGEHPNFDPVEFVRSGDTLFLTVSPDRQALYAPLIVALDEANTTAPIPLPNIISEAGGQGLHLIVGIQSIEPAVARWGPAARAFLTMFPTKAVFQGNFDRDTVQALSNAAGEYDRQQVSYSESVSYVGQYNQRITNTTPSYSTTRQKVLTEGDITSIPDFEACMQTDVGAQFATLSGTSATWNTECLAAAGYELGEYGLVPPGNTFDTRDVWQCGTPNPTPEQCETWSKGMDVRPEGLVVLDRLGCPVTHEVTS